MSIQLPSTPRQAAMLRTWEAHPQAEFVTHDIEAAMATMSAEPSVLHIGPMTGARGDAALVQVGLHDPHGLPAAGRAAADALAGG